MIYTYIYIFSRYMCGEESVRTYMHTHNTDKQNTPKHPATLFKSSIFLGGGGGQQIRNSVCPEARIKTMEKCI